MPIFEKAAKALNMTPEELERKSIRTFMEKELMLVEADIFKFAARHGVNSVLELDARLQKGRMI